MDSIKPPRIERPGGEGVRIGACAIFASLVNFPFVFLLRNEWGLGTTAIFFVGAVSLIVFAIGTSLFITGLRKSNRSGSWKIQQEDALRLTMYIEGSPSAKALLKSFLREKGYKNTLELKYLEFEKLKGSLEEAVVSDRLSLTS